MRQRIVENIPIGMSEPKLSIALWTKRIAWQVTMTLSAVHRYLSVSAAYLT